MSFSKITSDYKPKSQEIVIKLGDTEVKFYAKEVSYFTAQKIAIKSTERSDESLKELILNSIFDIDGKNMSAEQAEVLPREYADLFVAAAIKVNGLDKEEAPAEKN